LSAAIQFDRVSKKFILHHERARSFQELVVGLFRRNNRSREEFWALRDVSFAVEQGETVGIIGPNGAGKSTILKLISRIIEPTSGRIAVRGRIGALLELGAGFHPDLTGRENIYLNGSILGLSRAEIRRRLDDIIGFAELERFIDVPVKHYSSGMFVRLGFSVAVHTDPEILLVDEVLAVGDVAFQRKCLQRIREMQEEGVTILFVSHALDQIRRLCHRVLWLQDGHLSAEGDPEEVTRAYLGNSLIRKQLHMYRMGTGEVEITGAKTLDATGQECAAFLSGSRFIVRIDYRCHQPVDHLAFGLSIYAEDGTWVTSPNSILQSEQIEVKQQGSVYYVVDSLPLKAGTYHVTVAVFDGSAAPLYLPYDHITHACHFIVVERERPMPQDGLIEFPHRWLDEQGWDRLMGTSRVVQSLLP